MLEHLHYRDCAYRDLKAENLMLDEAGYINLIDFGLVKVLKPGERSYTVCGTVPYMAPEVVNKTGHGLECDWWSLGCNAFELITSSPPFGQKAKNPQQIFKEISNKDFEIKFPEKTSAELQSFIKMMLCHNPAERIGFQINSGAQYVKLHEYFTGLSWTGIIQKKIPAPSVPEKRIVDKSDIFEFDNFNSIAEWEPDPPDCCSCGGKETPNEPQTFWHDIFDVAHQEAQQQAADQRNTNSGRMNSRRATSRMSSRQLPKGLLKSPSQRHSSRASYGDTGLFTSSEA
mmetsp:Transcript_20610/g.44251  ORF Transcript_20610/g.44251 Transcript_20610/m.44251 type:complete len:286 (-) Transcript_20610:131-988(-)